MPRKFCPLCDHEFKGNGWEGIDAHWRSEHDKIMPYEDAWPLIEAEKFPTSLRIAKANLPSLSLAEICKAAEETAAALAQVALDQAKIAGGHAGVASPKVRQELTEAHQRRWDRLKIEYDAFTDEISRRSRH